MTLAYATEKISQLTGLPIVGKSAFNPASNSDVWRFSHGIFGIDMLPIDGESIDGRTRLEAAAYALLELKVSEG